jgi:enolase
MGAEVYHALKGVLKDRGLSTGIGDEGGFAPNLPGNEAALELLVEAIGRPATSPAPRSPWPWTRLHRAVPRRRYELAGDGRTLDSDGMVELWRTLATATRSCRSRTAWPRRTGPAGPRSPSALGDSVQLVGDDLFVTNVERSSAARRGAANSILIKVNQIGTLTETFDAVDLAHRSGYRA